MLPGDFDETYMNFSSGDKLACNFTGEDVSSAYSFENSEITQGNQVYKVESLSDKEMVVSTNLMDFKFKLTFTKVQ